MTTGVCVLELNDAELRVARAREVLVSAPGLAVVEGGRLRLGAEAAARQRLAPRQLHTRFWSHLSQDPIDHGGPAARHHADIAYAQLLDLHARAGEPDELILAVPGNLDRAQLALLLGIAQACPFRAVGLVDAAVAAAAAAAPSGSCVHVDVQLHATVITEMAVGAHIEQTRVRVVDGAGLLALHEACARVAAEAFLDESRFDPLDHGASDQALHEALPGWLHALAEADELRVALEHHGRRHQATLRIAQVLAATATLYERILGELPAARECLLSHRAARLPRLAAPLRGAVRALEPHAVFAGCESHAKHIRGEGDELVHVTALPVAARPPAAPAPHQAPPATVPTHVLHGHHGYALREQPLVLSADGSARAGTAGDAGCTVLRRDGRAWLVPSGPESVRINADPVRGERALAAGDRVTVGEPGAEFVLVSVVEPRGP